MHRRLAYSLTFAQCAIFATSFQISPIPVTGTVEQCSQLSLSWPEVTPPIHLHVQADRFINYTNLRDLGIQTGTSMTWTVDLPVDSPSFSFAFYTLENQYLVFQSDGVLRVVNGNGGCQIVQPSPGSIPDSDKPPSPTTALSSTSTSDTSTSASRSGFSSSSSSGSFGTSAPGSSNGISTPTNSANAAGGAAQSSNVVSTGVIVGAVLGGIVLLVIIVSLLYLCWRHERILQYRDREITDPPPTKVIRSPSQHPFLLDDMYEVDPLPFTLAPNSLATVPSNNSSKILLGTGTASPPPLTTQGSSSLQVSTTLNPGLTYLQSDSLPTAADGGSQPTKQRARVLYAERNSISSIPSSALQFPPANASYTEAPVLVHTDGGVRLPAEEIPPTYNRY